MFVKNHKCDTYKISQKCSSINYSLIEHVIYVYIDKKSISVLPKIPYNISSKERKMWRLYKINNKIYYQW